MGLVLRVWCMASMDGVADAWFILTPGADKGKSSESVQCAMLKACDACADMGQL